MDIGTIVRLLSNAGYNKIVTDGKYIYMEDPSCIINGFETFFSYAWIVIYVITGMLLAGWALSTIFGAKDDIFSNMKNLTMMFVVLSVIKPVMGIVYGKDLFHIGCGTVKVSISNLRTLLDMRKEVLSPEVFNLYEDIDITDTGALPVEEVNLPPCQSCCEDSCTDEL